MSFSRYFYHAYAELANQIANSQVDKSIYHTGYKLFTCFLVTTLMVHYRIQLGTVAMTFIKPPICKCHSNLNLIV